MHTTVLIVCTQAMAFAAMSGSRRTRRSRHEHAAQRADFELRQCSTPGCPVIHQSSRHRYCCDICGHTSGSLHSRRCHSLQRSLVRARLVPRLYTANCRVPGCNRGVGNGFSVCCSACGTGRHSRRCDGMWLVQQWHPHPRAASTHPGAGAADVADTSPARLTQTPPMQQPDLGNHADVSSPSADAGTTASTASLLRGSTAIADLCTDFAAASVQSSSSSWVHSAETVAALENGEGSFGFDLHALD